MKENKDKWIDDVLNSTQNSKRAQASEKLYHKIEAQLFAPKEQIISIQHWRMAAAAAAFLLFLNVFAMRQYNSSQAQVLSQSVEAEGNNQSILADFNFYDLP